MVTLEKRTHDRRLFDIDCSDLLDDAETISAVASIVADQGGLTFGAPAINVAEVEYPDEYRTAAIGKVIQVQIGDGTLPSGKRDLLCTIRARFSTNLNPRIEATVKLRLTDQVPDCGC